MSRILMTWELGAGYGHVDMLLPLARRLHAGGHDVVFAIKDVTRAGARLELENLRYVQAPLWLGPPVRRPPAASFGELLARFGYHDAPGLVSVLRAWRHTIELVAPDAILANHAPTALLAARGLGVPRLALGTGFECPPPGAPSLALLAAGQYPAERPRQADRDVVDAVNAALARLGLARIRHVTDVFEADAQCLCTVAELDVFHPARDRAGYLGPIMNIDQGVPASWPAAGEGRVFAYLNPAAPGFEPLLAALAAAPPAVLLHAPGAPAALLARHRSPSLAVSDAPVALRELLRECDFAVCNAGHGTSAAFLLAGRPLLLAPVHVEQSLNARLISSQGAGIAVGGARPDFAGALRRLQRDAGLVAAACAIAQRYPDLGPEQPIAAALAVLETLLASA